MRPRIPWFEMEWSFDTPASWWPLVLERLRHTPARCLAHLARLPEEKLKQRPGDDKWSILEHVGHLATIEALWLNRLDDFESGAGELRAADLTNEASWAADFNSRPMLEVFKLQGASRQRLMQRLDAWGDTDRWGLSAHHPRLDKPMRVIDLAVFVADHDDYHLAQIDELKRGLAGG